MCRTIIIISLVVVILCCLAQAALWYIRWWTRQPPAPRVEPNRLAFLPQKIQKEEQNVLVCQSRTP